MEIILQNILSNDMKAGEQVRIEVTQTNEWVRVTVRDNGPGMISHFSRACNWRMSSLDISIIRLLTAVAEANA